jgi:hypothetical protein
MLRLSEQPYPSAYHAMIFLQVSGTVLWTIQHLNILKPAYPATNCFAIFQHCLDLPALEYMGYLETSIPCYGLFCNFPAQSGPKNCTPGSGKLPIRHVNRHLLNRHHLIRDICNKCIENRDPGIEIFVRKHCNSVFHLLAS